MTAPDPRPAASQDSSTLAELLEWRAAMDRDRVGYIYLEDGVAEERRLTYGELQARAAALAGYLRQHVAPGERVLLLYPPGLEFVVALFACFEAGLVAVPVSSPGLRMDRALEFLNSIATDCEPRALLTTEAIAGLAAHLDAADGPVLRLPMIPTDQAQAAPPGPPAVPVSPRSLVFLQYTSGSTAAPKGVMVSHANLLANLRIAHAAIQPNRGTVCLSWLPHFHDMGLAGALMSVYGGFPYIFMSPLAFLEQPLRWLKAVTRYQATWTGAPNFAFDLCARRARPEDLDALDLSCLEVVTNGSEPVRQDTLQRFTAVFGRVGFRPEAMMPCYGLAEAVAFVAGHHRGRAPQMAWFNAAGLLRHRVEPTEELRSTGRPLVGCGRPGDGHELLIVDPEARRRTDPDEVGEIWFRGPSVAKGYWRRLHETKATFGGYLEDGTGPFLRTGDLGFVRDGNLFITGRLKDLIIIGGANHYPQEIERTIEASHPSIRPGCSAAFPVDAGGERLVVMAELRDGAEPREVMQAIRSSVAMTHELTVDGIGLMPARTIPKTSSGKIRRQACRAEWLQQQPLLVARWESAELKAAGPPAAADGPPAMGRPTDDDRPLGLEAAIRMRVATMLGDLQVPIQPDEPLIQLGLGSLQLAELKAVLEADLQLHVPLSKLLQGWSIRDITRVAQGQATAPPTPGRDGEGERYERLVNPEMGRLLRRLRMDKRFVRADGCWLFDPQGRRYLDAVAGFGAVPFGHNPAEIWEAINQVRARGEPAFVQPSSLEAAGDLADQLLAVAPPQLRYVAFSNSGAEAAEAAIKLARAARGRPGILSTEGGFHGKTLGALSATGRSAYQRPFGAPVAGFEFVPFGDLDALEQALARQPAAFIVEPIQGEGGIVEPPSGYLAGVRELCSRYEVLLVLDEIQTGLGRTGRMFACEEEGVTPDVLLVGKALGGGLIPVGAILYREEAASQDFALRHTSTFAGNTIGARVGIAVLELLTHNQGELMARVRANGSHLRGRLQELRARYPSVVRSVRGRGFLLGLELSSEWDDFGRTCLLGVMAEQEQLGALLSSYLLNVEGVRVAPTVLSSRVVRIEPPLVFSREMCDRVVEAMDRALEPIARRDTAAVVNHLLQAPRTFSVRTFDGPRTARPRSASTQSTDGRWAFVAHAIDADSYRRFDQSLQRFSSQEIEEISQRWSSTLEPFVAGTAQITSRTGATTYGEFVVVPRTTHELHSMEHRVTLDLVRDAVLLSKQRGASVVGLGGHLSVVTGASLELGDLGAQVTTGSSYTSVTAVEGTREILARLDLPGSEATMAVVGAAGSVGRGVALLLAREAGRLLLTGNPAHPQTSVGLLRILADRVAASLLEATAAGEPAPGPLARRVADLAEAGVADATALATHLLRDGLLVVGTDSDRLIPEADLVIAATSSPEVILGPSHFKSGAVVCDVARPLNVSSTVVTERPDVLVVEGGVVEVPSRVDLGWDFGLPVGTAFACMCEPMLLALEGRHPTTARVDTPVAVMHDLARQGLRHGFRLAALQGFGRPVFEEDWARIREVRSSTRRSARAAPAGPGG